MSATTLLREIEIAAAELGIAPTTLCRRAVEAGNLPRRLRNGGSVKLETAARIRSWIRRARRERRDAA